MFPTILVHSNANCVLTGVFPHRSITGPCVRGNLFPYQQKILPRPPIHQHQAHHHSTDPPPHFPTILLLGWTSRNNLVLNTTFLASDRSVQSRNFSILRKNFQLFLWVLDQFCAAQFFCCNIITGKVPALIAGGLHGMHWIGGSKVASTTETTDSCQEFTHHPLNLFQHAVSKTIPVRIHGSGWPDHVV